MITVNISQYHQAYWTAHLATIKKNGTSETLNLPYNFGGRDLYAEWWLLDYGVIIDHIQITNKRAFDITMTFKTQEDLIDFVLRWS